MAPIAHREIFDVKDYRKGSRADLTEWQIKDRLIYLNRAIKLYEAQISDCVQIREGLEEELLRRANEP